MKLPFGEWMPDQPALGNPGATIAKNVIPKMQGYGELRDLQAFTGALNAVCIGSVWAKNSSGTIFNHAGTSTQLLELQTDATWDNVSIAGNYTAAGNWEWAQLGDRLIAVDIGNNTQYFDMGTSTLYANLAGSPPKAKHVATIRNFVMMGNVNDGSAYPNRLAWSGYNNSTLWTPSRATQSDIRDLQGKGGDIQKIVPGQYGVIFQQNSIWVAQYSGPPTIFSLSEVEKGRGALAANSVCWAGNAVYYLSSDGFYRFTDRSEPIGAERVNRWFFNTADAGAVVDTRGVVDRKNSLVIWAFKSSGSLNYFDYLLFYNWVTNKWSYAQVDVEIISDYLTTGVTLEDLDALIGDIDSSVITLDSDAYKGGIVSMIAFDTSHQAATFQGDPLKATLETTEMGERRRTFVRNVRPLVDGANATAMVSSGTRNQQTENYTYTIARDVNEIGEANFRSNARYHRFRVDITGGFTDAVGVEIDAKPGGRR